MKHKIRWNAELREWFCVRCGRTSEKPVREDAEAEVELFECQPPLIECAQEKGRLLWIIRPKVGVRVIGCGHEGRGVAAKNKVMTSRRYP
jgi:hypothetical protein